MKPRLLRLALMLALGGAVTFLLGPFTIVLELAGLGAMATGTILAAPAARNGSGQWWSAMAAGTAAAAAGTGIALLLESLGGLIGVAGAILVISAAVLRYPRGDSGS